MMTFRTGRKVGLTIYDGDRLVGIMDTSELATATVRGLNDQLLRTCHEAVSKNSRWFHEHLQELLQTDAAQMWVVIHQERVTHICPTQASAIADARAVHGLYGGHAIHHVSVEANRPSYCPAFRIG